MLGGQTGPFLKKLVVGSESANNVYLEKVDVYNMYAMSESGFAVGVTVFHAKMGYDLPLAPLGDRELDADITYEVGTDGQTLTVSLPCGAGETYSVENPASNRLLLQERGHEGDKY